MTADGRTAVGEVWISVNGGERVNVSSLNSRAEHHSVVPVRLALRPGSINEVTFGVDGRRGKLLRLGIPLVWYAEEAVG